MTIKLKKHQVYKTQKENQETEEINNCITFSLRKTKVDLKNSWCQEKKKFVPVEIFPVLKLLLMDSWLRKRKKDRRRRERKREEKESNYGNSKRRAANLMNERILKRECRK